MCGRVRRVGWSGTGVCWENAVGGPLWTMGCEPGRFGGRPCDSPGLCREHGSVRVVRALCFFGVLSLVREVVVL